MKPLRPPGAPVPRPSTSAVGERSRRAWLAAGAGWAIATATAALAPRPAAARAAWPTRPLQCWVGFPAGSSADELARTLVGPLAAALGQPIEVENRPGAGGLAAATALAQMGDDHVLGLLPGWQLTVARWLQPSLGYDPLTDLRGVSVVASTPLLLCLSPHLATRGSAALRAIAEAGAAWQYGSPGAGSPFHLGMELLKAHTGWQIRHVPYPGNPQVVNALLQGEVQVALLPPALAVPHWRTARLPVAAVTSPRRSVLLPALPTLAERGVAGYGFEHWYALAAPLALAPEAAQRLARALARVVRERDVQQRLQAQGWHGVGSTPQALAQRVATETARLRPIIERQHIRIA